MTFTDRVGDDPVFTVIQPADGWTADEALLFMAGWMDRDVPEEPLTAAAEIQTGAMIALVPTDRDLRRLAVPGGESLDQLHLTLMYLGKAADWTLEQRVALEIQLETYLDILAPIDAEGFAIAIFNPPGNGRDDGMDRETCLVELCSGSALAVVHNYVTRGVRNVEDLPPIPDQHSPWIPHVTLAYTQDMELAPKLTALTGPITFDRVRVAFAGEHHDIALQGTLTASALG